MDRNTILVHAPFGRDAELIVSTLNGAGLSAAVEPSFASMLDAGRDGSVGALLMTAEALSAEAVQAMSETLSNQPKWSDLPVLVLVPGGRESSLVAQMEASLRTMPSITLLERPIRPVTLVSIAGNALRSRSRQYEVQRFIEEKEQTAAALVQSEKLAAVGRLASSIAHEINNPLEAVTNLLYLIRGEPGLSEAGREYVHTADRELTRVSQIVSQTLRFHRQATSASVTRPEALLNEVLDIYKSRLTNSQVDVTRDYEPEVSVTCYEGDIRQVLSNLIGNAFDVMRNGGKLTLRTRRLTWWATGETGVMFTVADNGPGMLREVSDRIFEAFYSTKGIHGTGLGLWISRRIVEKHRGHLLVRSRAGHLHGTVFQLWLPNDLAQTASESWHDDQM